MNAVDKQDTQPTFFDNSLTGFFHISSYHCISDCGGHSWSFHIRIKFGMRLVVMLLRGKPGLANIFSSFLRWGTRLQLGSDISDADLHISVKFIRHPASCPTCFFKIQTFENVVTMYR